jgi:PAS domain S-box-containing protein
MLKQNLFENILRSLAANNSTLVAFLQASSPDGLWYWDAQASEHYVSPEFWVTLGYEPSDIPQHENAWQDLIQLDDWHVALANIQKHLADPNHSYDQVLRYRHKDGSTVWLYSRGAAIRDEDGKPLGMLGTYTDVTRFRNAEKQERENAQDYQAILNNQKAYIIKTDAEANYTYANDLFLTMFNLERDTIMGTSSINTIYVEDHPKTIDTAIACLENPYQHFTILLRKLIDDGSFKTTNWDFMGLTDDQGKTSEILCVGVDVTQQLSAETDLQHKSTLLENAERIANMGAYEVDLAADRVTLTDQAYAILELPIGTPLDIAQANAFNHPDDLPIVLEAMKKAIEQQESQEIECRLITAQDNHRWVRNSGRPIVENGQVTRLIGMFQDITEQKEAELALHQSEARYRLLAENSQDLIGLNNLDGTFVYASPAYERLLGYSQAEIFALPPQELIHPNDASVGQTAHQAALAGQPVQVQYRLKKKDGSYLWVESIANLVSDDVSGEQQLLASSRDITNRKRAEDALRESEAKFRSLVENANDAIVILNLQGEYLYISPKGTEMNSVSRESFIGQSFETVVHPEDIDKVHQALGAIISSKQPYEGLVYRAMDGGGSWHWYASSGAPLFDDAGNVTAILAITRDITRDKVAEQAMRTTLERLEQSNKQNTMLMKEIHHRVKNNLAVISALLSLRARGLKDASAKDALQESRDRIKVMAEVHELMYQHDSNERIAFDKYLSGLVERMQRSFGSGKQQIRFALEVGQVELGIDQAVPLGLIINELLTNTVKHAFAADHPDPNVTITVAADDKHIKLTVTDNGVGVADTTTLETSDTLGMTVINSLTEQLEGQVIFENRPRIGVGLQVTLQVPLA